MGEKMNRDYNFESGAAAFNYNNVTGGGGDSASGGSGGSGMECMQLRSSPGPFHYLISEQAKSLVALQELQNEVGALLEFRDLVIETFPNLRSKMAPSTPASGGRRDWEPGVRVRRKLAAGQDARAKPQPSVQDSGFSTETSCGKDAASASRARPLEDELWALLDVIQRKGGRLRDEAEILRAELDERPSTDTAEESFARALQSTPECEGCVERIRLRSERDALLARAAALEAAAALGSPPAPSAPLAPHTPQTPLGRLDRALDSPASCRVATPDSKKFAAILQESNPVELQRQLLIATVQNQVLQEKLQRAAVQRSVLLQRLEQTRDQNDDLRFRLEEKNIEVEGARARARQLEARAGSPPPRHSSMRELQPLDPPGTPRRRPSRIPLHTAHKPVAPRPPPRAASRRARRRPRRPARRARVPPRAPPAAPPPPITSRRPPAPPPAPSSLHAIMSIKTRYGLETSGGASRPGAALAHSLAAEYVSRTERLAPRLAPLFPRLNSRPDRPLPLPLAYDSPQNLALELCKSILYENADSIDIETLKSINSHGDDSLWNNKPQQYFESMNYAEHVDVDGDEGNPGACSEDSLAS